MSRGGSTLGGYQPGGSSQPINFDLDLIDKVAPGAVAGGVINFTFPGPATGVDWFVGCIDLFSQTQPVAVIGSGNLVVTLGAFNAGSGGFDDPSLFLVQYLMPARGFSDHQTFAQIPIRIAAITQQVRVQVAVQDAADAFAQMSRFLACRLRGWQVPAGIPLALFLFSTDPARIGLPQRAIREDAR